MKKITYKIIFVLLTGIGILQSSCKKEWLDAKPSQDLVVPSTVKDFQSLLDNTNVFTYSGSGLGEIASDNISITYDKWQASEEVDRNTYVWMADPFKNNSVPEWNLGYQSILHENIAIEGLEEIKEANSSNQAWNNAKGTALFYRAYDFFSIAQMFCRPYTTNANSDLGVVLRLSSDVNEKSTRATVQETYQQIISDLNQAKSLLPEIPLYKTRPSLPAVYAMLSRVYLSMRDYDNALIYADSTLQHYNKLLDYSTLNASARRPFPLFNDEVILQWSLTNYLLFYNANPDPALLASYDSNDLRKSLFFSSTNTFRNSYSGNGVPFNGLATDEILLTRAECFARKGNFQKAAEDLTTLMQKRWKNNGTFQPYSFSNAQQALETILQERRKELVMRGLRWIDLRRLNQEPEFAITLHHSLNGTAYSLPPNDLKYVFTIPQQEINSSGLTQNPR